MKTKFWSMVPWLLALSAMQFVSVATLVLSGALGWSGALVAFLSVGSAIVGWKLYPILTTGDPPSPEPPPPYVDDDGGEWRRV